MRDEVQNIWSLQFLKANERLAFSPLGNFDIFVQFFHFDYIIQSITIVINYKSMNPENINPHIPLRHSVLWRKPLLYEKEVQLKIYPSKQLNQLAQQKGIFWKQRNNFIKTRSQSNKTLVRSQKIKEGRLDESRISKATNLVQTMQFLKFSKQTEGSSYVLAKYPGIIRPQKVYNDYHPKVSNPNYNRNIKGKHFTG